ncbi:MAG: helix-turn-helix domain-containing protein [Bacteroidales bacterium]|nr:helix-turn-helix domain-containing protein [Candidatus Scybalousia scybalohippi]
MDINLILNRLKQIKKFQKDRQLVEFFEVKASTFSSWRARNTIDFELLCKKCQENNISIDELLSEECDITKMQQKVKEFTPAPVDTTTQLVNILQNNLAEKDKQIASLLSIIDKLSNKH